MSVVIACHLAADVTATLSGLPRKLTELSRRQSASPTSRRPAREGRFPGLVDTLRVFGFGADVGGEGAQVLLVCLPPGGIRCPHRGIWERAWPRH
ncbi:hypothetical protein [Streptomyces sp. NBC_01429]|uniref:hypothetical protein n=1 Tax=Streptomyces sp. NBC_01429 TaxID=2903862 RepID=UPI002E2C2682|nr:hypothetical protein [Streptomyces sp. NBC_01429]